jgi:hypothetical protein
VEEREALNQTAIKPVKGLAELDDVIERIQESLFGDKAKPSLADLTRLLELRRELAHLEPESVIARWIDECPQTPDREE